MNKLIVNKLFFLLLIASGLFASHNNENNKRRSRVRVTQEGITNYLSRIISENYSPVHDHTHTSFDNFKNKVSRAIITIKENQKSQQENILFIRDELKTIKENVGELEENTRYNILKNKDSKEKVAKKIEKLSKDIQYLKSNRNKSRFGRRTKVSSRQRVTDTLRKVITKPYEQSK